MRKNSALMHVGVGKDRNACVSRKMRVSHAKYVCLTQNACDLVGLMCIFVFFQKGEQKVSKIAKILVTGGWLFAIVSLVLTLLKTISWLTYLYYFSYIKLAVTLIKYMPQVSKCNNFSPLTCFSQKLLTTLTTFF